MNPEEIGRCAAELTGGSAEISYGGITVDVEPERWVGAAAGVRDEPVLAFDFFDWLSAVDELEQGFAVLLHLYSITHRHRLLLRTRIPLAAPRLSTVTGVFPGAAWHERETHEMFGIEFIGHPELKPLLLPDGFRGNPLRKEFVLASRVAKEWPGAREPGEGRDGTRRRRMQPLGIPEPGTWGPDHE